MSRSNPKPTNPAQRFFQWSGSKGQLEWYDKEKGERIPVKAPFAFMVLDELATIAGFCEPDGSGYWSNEVRSVASEEFTVRTSKGVKAVGFYKELTDVRSHGAKYAKSIYIAFKLGDGYAIGNIKASGAALTAWINLGKKCKVQNGTVVLTGSTKDKKGATVFHVPTFEYRSSTPEENSIAVELDKELQVYLSQYLAANQTDHTEPENEGIDPAVGLASPEEIADYNERKAKAKAAKGAVTDTGDVVIEDIGDEPINMDDIPF